MTCYGITHDDEYRHGLIEHKRDRLEIWSGPFYHTREADIFTRDGAKSATGYDYSGEKFRVTLPEGVTFPRTDENYEQIDAAISAAYEAHNARLGRIRMEVPA